LKTYHLATQVCLQKHPSELEAMLHFHFHKRFSFQWIKKRSEMEQIKKWPICPLSRAADFA
jgi:hypothetical protein